MSDVQSLQALTEKVSSALEARDEQAYRAASTAAGWEAKGDSARRLWQQSEGNAWTLKALKPPTVNGDRASIGVAIIQADRQGPVGTIHLLCIKDGGEWKLEGVSNVERVVAAFNEGTVGALTRYRDLDSDASIDAWAKSQTDVKTMLAGVPDAASHIERATAAGITLKFVESRYLATTERGVALFDLAKDGEEYPDQLAVLVAKDGGDTWTPKAASDYGDMQLLLS